MVLQGVTAKGNLNGLLFELTVEQRYRNPAETNIEAVYTFPLPSGAVLLDFEVKLDGKTLTGVVVEKRAAEAQYEEAIEKGDTAIMLERAGDGLCTVNLGNLMAGEEATIRYRYAQLLRFEHGSVRLAVPTVIAPRYGDPSAAGLQPHQQPINRSGRRLSVRADDRRARRRRQGKNHLALAPDRHRVDRRRRDGVPRQGRVSGSRFRAGDRPARRDVVRDASPATGTATWRWRASAPTCPATRPKRRCG